VYKRGSTRQKVPWATFVGVLRNVPTAISAADIAVQTVRETPTKVVRATFCLVEPRLYRAFQNATAAGE
jgi:hypothetical protein